MLKWKDRSRDSKLAFCLVVAVVVALLIAPTPFLLRYLALKSRVASLMSEDAAVRAAAVASLKDSDCSGEIGRLIALMSASVDESEKAMRALVEIGPPAALLLSDRLTELSRLRTRGPFEFTIFESRILGTLGSIGDVRAMRPILDAWTRYNANTFEWQQVLVQQRGFYDAAVAALSGMGESGAKRMVEESKRLGFVPGLYRDALLDLARRGVIGPVIDNAADPAIIEAAVWILALSGDKRAVDPLISLLAERKISPWYVAVGLTLAGDEKALKAVESFINEGQAPVNSAFTYPTYPRRAPQMSAEDQRFFRMFNTLCSGGPYFFGDLRDDFVRRYWLSRHPSPEEGPELSDSALPPR